MPRATRSTAKQPSRGQARTAAASRKKVTKTTAKTPARASKTPSTARRATTSKTARTATPPPAKSAARSRAATKTAKTPAKAATKSVTRSVTRSATRSVSKSTATKTATKPATKAATKVPAKRALRPEDKKFLAEQKALLLEERKTYTQQAENLKAEADQLAEDMEPGDIQFDEESGEGGTMNVERERDLALSAQALSAVEEIDKALAKITDGSYGYCEQCGQPIPKARLKALPYASLCVACKSGGLSRR
jgi:DnaK suppressor protein